FGFSFGIFSDLIIQPLINNIYSLEFYGIIFGIVGIIKTFLLIYSHKIITFFEKRNLEFTFLILIWPLLLVLFINFISNIYLVTVIIGIMWSLGIYRIVIISDKLNSEIEDDSKRATILSSNSMVTSLVLILVFPIFGFLSDLISLEKVIYVLVGYSLVAGFILLYFKK
ncbi:MAG: hypothetical protein HRU03_06725, partial [Nanoarchaeales archaeon]|nr:hypothetical protein [Nanoarchaeales archaeon]